MAFSLADWLGESSILSQAGLYTIILPFILIFVILFAILDQLKLFGANSKNFNALISFILALFITFSTDFTTWFAEVVARYTGAISVILIGLLLFYILAWMVTGDDARGNFFGKIKPKWLIFLIVLILAFLLFGWAKGLSIFGFSLSGLGNLGGFFGGIDFVTIIVIAIFALLIFLALRAMGLFKSGTTHINTPQPNG